MCYCLIFISCVIDNVNYCQVILEMGAQLCPIVSAGYLNPEESFFMVTLILRQLTQK